MEPKIKSVQRGLPLPPRISSLSRTPRYRITGQGFGDQPGKVKISYSADDRDFLPRIYYWSDTLVEIQQPPHDPLGRDTGVNALVLTRFRGKRSQEFELVP